MADYHHQVYGDESNSGGLIHPTRQYTTFWWALEFALWLVVLGASSIDWVLRRKAAGTLHGWQLHRLVVVVCALFTMAAAARLAVSTLRPTK